MRDKRIRNFARKKIPCDTVHRIILNGPSKNGALQLLCAAQEYAATFDYGKSLKMKEPGNRLLRCRG